MTPLEWFTTPNPLLGDVIPLDMIKTGRGDKLCKLIVNMVEENKPAEKEPKNTRIPGKSELAEKERSCNHSWVKRTPTSNPNHDLVCEYCGVHALANSLKPASKECEHNFFVSSGSPFGGQSIPKCSKCGIPVTAQGFSGYIKHDEGLEFEEPTNAVGRDDLKEIATNMKEWAKIPSLNLSPTSVRMINAWADVIFSQPPALKPLEVNKVLYVLNSIDDTRLHIKSAIAICDTFGQPSGVERCKHGVTIPDCFECYPTNPARVPTQKQIEDVIKDNVNNIWYENGDKIDQYRFSMKYLPVVAQAILALLKGEKT